MANHMSAQSHAILRRLEAVEARLEATIRRARGMMSESPRGEEPESEAVRHLDEIETKLEALEERLRKMEQEMRWKESPPESLGTERPFSTGLHFPGLG